jgi:hypothetical protein
MGRGRCTWKLGRRFPTRDEGLDIAVVEENARVPRRTQRPVSRPSPPRKSRFRTDRNSCPKLPSRLPQRIGRKNSEVSLCCTDAMFPVMGSGHQKKRMYYSRIYLSTTTTILTQCMTIQARVPDSRSKSYKEQEMTLQLRLKVARLRRARVQLYCTCVCPVSSFVTDSMLRWSDFVLPTSFKRCGAGILYKPNMPSFRFWLQLFPFLPLPQLCLPATNTLKCPETT